MHTEIFCRTLPDLDRVEAIRAIHQALLQIEAMGTRVEAGGTTYDNAPALAALSACLTKAGHIGFTP